MSRAYDILQQRARKIGLLSDAQSMLGWDRAAMMPDGGAAARAEQIATLDGLIHELTTAADMPDLLAAAEAEGGLDPWQVANLREMRRGWQHAAAVPADLVEALSRASSVCEMAWRTARADNDFAGLQPLLAEVLGLVRAVAAAKADAFGCTPYDALLDAYEPGGRAAEIDGLFADIAGWLPGLIEEAITAQARFAPQAPAGPFPEAEQKRLGTQLMAALGFDFAHGRLDVSHHPFCGGVPDDVRLTTRYDPADFTRALMGVLHETGHALYEQGLPKAWRHQPVGSAAGMALHESQSLLIEMQICRARPFLTFAAPLMRAAFGGEGPAWDAENLYRLGVRVQRSLIRVDADEVTYPAHVILRYRLERDLIAGDLMLPDLPGAWAEGMRALIGITPPDDRDGCLQDIHWPCGAFGYFPTYTLGAITAAQIFAAIRRALPDIDARISAGDFSPVLGWLRTHIHEKGRLMGGADLIRSATGGPLATTDYQAHLRRRYLDQ